MFFIIGLLLRLSFINKPEGLWNDEYVSWFIANTSEGFWHEVLRQCHMPLYYLYLKPFSHCSDLVLRLTSVIPGVIAIPVMYLAGKEFSKKTGVYAASITSVLSFLVYYSQEVRFYSLLFLFSALSLLFTLRYLRKSNKKNLACWIVSNVLILLTHILGGIYVFFNTLFVMRKNFSRTALYVFTGIALILIPAGLHILGMLPSSQWWGHFSYTNILFLFSDFFSPILTNNVNAPPVFFYNKSLAVWMCVPTLIALAGIVAGIKRGLLYTVLGTICVMSFLALSGKIVFITKYSIEILPILILLFAAGLIRMKKIGTVLLSIFILFHLAAFFTPYYVSKIPRSEGHRIVGEILNKQNSDNIIFTYYEPNRFGRYTNFGHKNLYYISKANRFEYREDPARILKNIKKGATVSVVFLDSVSFFDDNYVRANLTNPRVPEMFLTFSAIKNSLIEALSADFNEYEVTKAGSWTVIKARRFK